MAAVARPGINEKWQKAWPATVRNRDAWFRDHWARETDALRYYTRHGKKQPSSHLGEIAMNPVDPPRASWEDAYVAGNLRVVAALQQWKWERAAIEDGRWDGPALATMFTGARLAELVALHVHTLFPGRHRGRTLATMDPMGFCHVALGLIAGDPEAMPLAQALVEALRRGLYDRSGFRPTSAFIAGLLADHAGKPVETPRGDRPPLHRGEVAADPVLADMLSNWRHPDPAAIVPQCLAACDVHTHLASPGPTHRREFLGAWSRTPVVVLLVFRLRAMRGLGNPRIQHPLMDSILGALPPPAEPVPPDDVLAFLLERMRKDGFDEVRILADYRA